MTGGTGTLGQQLVEKFSTKKDCTIYTSYRDEYKRNCLFDIAIDSSANKVNLFKLDLEHTERLFLPFTHSARNDHVVLVNAAGICLQGSSKTALKRSLSVNLISPVLLSLLALSHWSRRGRSAAATTTGTCSIVNINSGDGELGNLRSDVADAVRTVSSLEALSALVLHFLATHDPQQDLAHGPSPAYSLSKALLNRATAIMHREYGCSKAVRVLACCPGDFASPMSTPEELQHARPVAEAAAHIVEMACDREAYPGGRFYRDGKLISW